MKRLFGIGVGILLAALVAVAPAFAIPKIMSYQGRLNDNTGTPVGTPVSATVAMTFTIWSAETLGTDLWHASQSVQVSNGIFSVELGSDASPLPDTIFSSDTLYLGIKVGTDNEMVPRQRITSGAYAFRTPVSGQRCPFGESLVGFDGDGGLLCEKHYGAQEFIYYIQAALGASCGVLYKMDSRLGMPISVFSGKCIKSVTISADNNKIAFISSQSTTGVNEIFVMDTDGGNVLQITSNENPSFASFGQNNMLWYTSSDSRRLYQVNIDGSGKTLLSSFICPVSDFGASSDGTSIVYGMQPALNCDWAPTTEIFIAKAAFSSTTRITNDSVLETSPRFSPEGSRLVFYRADGASGYNPPYNLYVMNVDGSGTRQLATCSSGCYYPSFSLDSMSVAYSCCDSSQCDICVAPLMGGSVTKMTSSSSTTEYVQSYGYK